MCDACEVHEDGMDNLSRHGLDHSSGDYGVKVEDTGMGEAAGRVRRVFVPPTRVEGGWNSPLAARPRRSHSLLEDVKPAVEGQEAP